MKKSLFLLTLILLSTLSLKAEETTISLSGTFMNRYIWRGNDYGNSPVIQPSLTLTHGRFSVGAWGNYSLSANTQNTEADLWMSYDLGKNTTIIVTDYYFPHEPQIHGDYFYEYAHTLELGLSHTIKGFTASICCEVNNLNTLYTEINYTHKNSTIYVGGGSINMGENFHFTNIGVSHTKDIRITDSYALPIIGGVTLNPYSEELYITFGFRLE
ncbi:MAG: hypothetical protein N4A37_08250 [Prolixibacteraceae bacterium]|nr:hypothetical protein [Prolixibacteraceae bacterium]